MRIAGRIACLKQKLGNLGVSLDLNIRKGIDGYNDLCQIRNNQNIFNFLTGPIMDTASFSRLSDYEKKLLERLSNESTKKAAAETIPVAQKIKTFLDRKFGKGKYTFVSIGRSPVMVGKGLEGMGVEAKYVPISGLHPTCNILCGEPKHNILDNIEADRYIEFLKSIGLSRKAVRKSGKEFVFYDYTSSGDTLKEMKNFFRKRVGLPFFKSHFRSINEDLKNICLKNHENLLKRIDAYISGFSSTEIFENNFPKEVEYIERYWFNCWSSDFSHIPSLEYTNVNKVFEVINKFKAHNGIRFFNFNILNMLEKAGLLVQKQN